MTKINRKQTPKSVRSLRAQSAYEAFEARQERRDRVAFTILLMVAWAAIVVAWTVTR